MTSPRPDVVILMTDEERAAPPYETPGLRRWRRDTLTGAAWFDDHALNFTRHYTGSLACVPSRPTIFTGQYPDVHGVTQTDGLGKMADDSRMRWLPEGEVPTLGHWFRAAGYDTHYDGKWHISHADLHDADGERITTNDDDGLVDAAAVERYLAADPLGAYGFSGWVGPEPHGGELADAGVRRDPLIAARVVAWLEDRYERRRAGDGDALRPFLLVASFVNPHDIVLFPAWARRGNPLTSRRRSIRRRSPPPRPPARTWRRSRRRRSPTGRPTRRGTGRTGRSPASTRSGRSSTATSTTASTPRSTGRLDQVRRAVTDGGSEHAVIVRTSDHGELLGAHGGLHQKWFTLYDEATRVPFSIARVGGGRHRGHGRRRADVSRRHRADAARRGGHRRGVDRRTPARGVLRGSSAARRRA